MPRAESSRSLRAALLAARWDGFQTAAAIADSLERWSLATVTDRLHSLAREGLLWSVREGAGLTFRFAQIRSDTADIIIPNRHQPVRRIAA